MLCKLKNLNISKQISNLVQVLLMFYWLTMYLPESDSNYGIYLICGILAFVGTEKNYSILEKWHKVIVTCIACVFSIIVVLANYHLLTNVVGVILMLISGHFIAWNALCFLYNKLLNANIGERTEEGKKELPPYIIFAISMVAIVVIDLVYLFLCDYPGNLSPDSVGQVGQTLANSYTNHHPFWHTIIIKICVTIGFKLFGEINAAIVVYTFFQVLFMAACFSLVVVTLYQLRISYKWIILGWVWYGLMPYHINYATTIWKDVMFGGGVLLFVVSLFRIWFQIGQHKWLNYIIFICSCMCFGLLRNNGLIALALTTFCMIIFFRAKYKKIYLILALTIISCYILKGPFLDAIGVAPTGIQESLSIPLQQVARVIVDEKEITEEQREKIEKIIDISSVPELYLSYISDPIKGAIDREYLADHKMEYLLLWIDIGLDHPWTYIKAWVDQTKGYWNGGYEYWISAYWVHDNDLGIYRTINSLDAYNAAHSYLRGFENNQFWGFLKGIGFHVWVAILLGVLNWFRGDKRKAFLSLPVFFVVCTLLIATPVYSEFRYAYAVFTCIPFLTLITFCKGEING